MNENNCNKINPSDFNMKTYNELIVYCKSNKIKGYSGKNKEYIIGGGI